MKRFFLIVTLIVLSACEENKEAVIPKGFERLGGEGAVHFVYVHKNMVGNRVEQRKAGLKICEKYKNDDYCEVYMWRDKRKVATSLPFKGSNTSIGVFEIKNGKAKLKALR